VDLQEGHFLVAGPQRSGKSTALATIACSLREGMPDIEFRLLAPRPTPLEDLSMWVSIARGDDCENAATSLQATIEERLVDAEHQPVVVVVDDAEELTDDGSRALESVARRGRDRNVRVIAASEIRSAHHAFGGLLSEMKRAKQGVLLNPELEIDGDLFGVRLPRPADTARPAGRGFLVARGATTLVQVAHS
jgi:S-DNA-T family DNA segregation ATPase FtsK/SpoIIIE